MNDDKYNELMLSIKEISKELKKIETNNNFLFNEYFSNLNVKIDDIGERLNNENIYYINRETIQMRGQCKILEGLIEQIHFGIDDQGDSKNAR